MKKLLAIFMVLTLLLSLVACSGNTVDSDDDEEEQEAKKITIDETVICDQNGIKVTVTKLSFKEGKSKATLEFEIENTGDSTVAVSSDFICFNDICMQDSMWSEVEGGETVTEEVVFTELDEIDLSVIQTIYLQVHASDPESYDLLFTSSPVTLETSAADDDYEQTFDDDGRILYESDKFRIILRGTSEGEYASIFIENNTEQTWAIYTSDVTINNGDGDNFFYTTLPAGKKSYGFLHFYANTDEEETPAIETVTFKFVFSNQDNSDYSEENFFRSEFITVDFE